MPLRQCRTRRTHIAKTEGIVPVNRPHVFSLRACCVLVAASALWVWIFRDLSSIELLVLSSVAFVAGTVSHLVYAFWLPWRVTAIAVDVMLYNGLLAAQLLFGSGTGTSSPRRLAFLIDVLVEPAQMATYARTPSDILFFLAVLFGTLVFTPAHAIRPSLPSAIITALGISIWYGSSIMMMAYGG